MTRQIQFQRESQTALVNELPAINLNRASAGQDTLSKTPHANRSDLASERGATLTAADRTNSKQTNGDQFDPTEVNVQPAAPSGGSNGRETNTTSDATGELTETATAPDAELSDDSLEVGQGATQGVRTLMKSINVHAAQTGTTGLTGIERPNDRMIEHDGAADKLIDCKCKLTQGAANEMNRGGDPDERACDRPARQSQAVDRRPLSPAIIDTTGGTLTCVATTRSATGGTEQRQQSETEQWPTQDAQEDNTDAAFEDLANIDVTDLHKEDLMQKDQLATEFAQAQRTDPSLQIGWSRAERGSDEFKILNGLLYKRTERDTNTVEDFALAVPQKYRDELLAVSHSCISSGHLGVNKSKQRLQAHFYWPKLYRDVADYVKRCKICQLTSPLQTKERVPLQPMTPELDTLPFSSISIDCVGPQLNQTARGNRYLLCILCNSTKYLQVYPLRNLRASSICDKLLSFWCSVGLPKEIFCDQMSSFKSELMAAVTDKFGIDMRYSAVYHSQSHGGIERAQRTLEDMLRKFVANWSNDWDRHVQFLQFAYNSATHSSTGFSPFELVYGRKVSTPLALQRQSWENNDFAENTLKVPVAKYMHELCGKIQTMLHASHEHMSKAGQRMKTNFDKQSTERHLNVNDLVIVLLPTSDKKLEHRWMGPVRVTKKLNRNNYEVNLGHRKAIFHINGLRRFHSDPRDGDSVRPTMTVIDDEFDEQFTDTTQTSPQGVSELASRTARQTAIRADWQADQLTPDTDTTERQTDRRSSNKAGASEHPDFVTGEQLNQEQRKQMTELLTEFSSVFQDTPGRTNLTMHKIELTDQIPCWQPSYPIPHSLRNAVEQELNKMERNGVISLDLETKYNNPLIIVRKKDNTIRLVNNFILLNEKTIKVKYDMANANEIINRVAGAKIISKLDLSSFFYQIELSPECRKYTGFYTPFGTYSFNMMAQGLCGAPITAQKLIDRLLRGCHRYASALQDDIIVFSDNWQSHLNHLRDVLERLWNAGLTANVKKCMFGTHKVVILGFVIDNGHVCMDEDKIRAVTEWKKPKSKSQLKSFLGFTNFVRHMIYRYADIAAPLLEMLPRNRPEKLEWNEIRNQAFENLRMALISKPVLRAGNPQKPYQIFTDASSVSVGGVLTQEDDTGNKYVVSYTSRKLLPHEARYSTIEKELLSIVNSLQKFRQWIFSNDVQVFSDHRPLKYLNALTKHSNRLARWALILQDYNVKTTFVKGELQWADALTRTPNMYE